MKKVLFTLAGVALIALSVQSCRTVAAKPKHVKVGSYEVYVLQENAGDGNTGVLIDPPVEVLAEYAPDGTYPTATNAVLILKGDSVWLVDTGFGQKIFDKMAAMGIEPGDVDEVLLTHLHGDHIGGMFRDGAKAFPNATVSLAQPEFDYWSGERNEAAMKIFSEYGDAVRTLSPVEIDATAQDGITPISAYGHTPGHTMFMLRDGGEQLLIWGDVAHAMAVQMPHPEISVRYDTDPDAARESRLKVLRHVAATKTPVIGMHIPATTECLIFESGSGYDFIAQ